MYLEKNFYLLDHNFLVSVSKETRICGFHWLDQNIVI